MLFTAVTFFSAVYAMHADTGHFVHAARTLVAAATALYQVNQYFLQVDAARCCCWTQSHESAAAACGDACLAYLDCISSCCMHADIIDVDAWLVSPRSVDIAIQYCHCNKHNIVQSSFCNNSGMLVI